MKDLELGVRFLTFGVVTPNKTRPPIRVYTRTGSSLFHPGKVADLLILGRQSAIVSLRDSCAVW